MRRAFFLPALALGMAGCYAGVAIDDGRPQSGDEPTQATTGDVDNDDDDDGGGDSTGAPSGDPTETCTVARHTARTRLTAFEYENTIRSALGVALDVQDTLPGDELLESGFVQNAESRVDETMLRAYQLVAETVAEAVELSNVELCEDGASCAEDTIAALGRRLYRRPLTPTEHERWTGLYNMMREDGDDHARALRLVVEGMLQSPRVLYQSSVGDPSLPAPDGYVALSHHELAARLSYLLWDDIPDAELDALADNGVLDDPEVLEAQTLRMLDDPRARPAIQRYFAQWLDADAVAYTSQAEGLGAAMHAETRAFVDWLMWDPESTADVNALISAEHTFVDAELAAHYGLEYPAGADGVRRVPVPADRPGVLGHGTLLARAPQKIATIKRGLHIADRFLCQTPPPPNSDLDTQQYGDLSPREAAEARVADPTCGGCHRTFEAIAFAMEAFDATGRRRTSYPDGSSIDLVGWFPVGGNEVVEFDGLGTLATVLSEDPNVQPCIATQGAVFAFGNAPEEACTHDDLIDAFVTADGDFRSLFVALALSDAFRYRLSSEDEAWSC